MMTHRFVSELSERLSDQDGNIYAWVWKSRCGGTNEYLVHT